MAADIFSRNHLEPEPAERIANRPRVIDRALQLPVGRQVRVIIVADHQRDPPLGIGTKSDEKRKQKQAEERQSEQQFSKLGPTIRPLWYLALGIVLVLTAAFIWWQAY